MKGIMGYLSKKVAFIILILIFLSAWGSYAFIHMSRDYLPPIKNTNLMVTIQAPGLTQTEINQQITIPLSEQLHQLNHLDSMESHTYNQGVMLRLTYDAKTDIYKARSYLRESLNDWTQPESVQKPKITMISSNAFPVMEISLTSNKVSLDHLLTNEKDQVKHAIEQLPGVEKVVATGGAEEGYVITLKPNAMAAHHVTTEQIVDALNKKNISLPQGLIKSGQEHLPVKVSPDKISTHSIEDQTITSENGDVVKLGNIADVEPSMVNQSFNVRTHGSPAVMLAVFKTPSADIIEVGQSVKKRLHDLPVLNNHEVSSKIILDKGKTLNTSLMSLFREGLLGCLFSMICVWLFFRNVRLSLLVGMALPISYFMTMICLHLMGKELNLLTLSGVIIAMGRVVDDSIVVIDNVLRNKDKVHLTFQNITQGVTSIAQAVVASTLTTIVVFLPFAFVTGMIKQAISGFAWAVTFALLSSLLVSLVILPPFIIRYRHRLSLTDKPDKFHSKAKGFVLWSFKRRSIFIPMFALLLIGSILLSFHIPLKLFARSQQNDIVVQIEGPENNPMPTLNAETSNLEAFLDDNPNVVDYTATVGGAFRTTFDDVFDQNGGWLQRQNVANVVVSPKEGASTEALVKELNHYISKLSSSATYAVSSQDISGDDSRVRIVLSGSDENTLNRYATKIKSKLSMIDDLFIYGENDTTSSYEVKLNEKKMKRYGIQKQEVYNAINPYLKRNQTGYIQTNSGQVPYELKQDGDIKIDGLKRQDIIKQTILQVGRTKLKGEKGEQIRLAEIASLEVNPNHIQVTKNGKSVALIEGSILSKNPEKTAGQIRKALSDTTLPPGMKYEFGGFTKQIRDMVLTLGITAFLAMILILMVIQSIFRGFRAPLAILLSLPFAFSGSIIGLYAMNGNWNLGSIIGMVMLLGIATTNKIVLVDKIEKNMLSYTALYPIISGVSSRVRPVMMTALTTILTLIPLMILGNDQGMVSRSLAICVVFGMITSTITTLVLVPSIYYWLLDKKHPLQRGSQMPS